MNSKEIRKSFLDFFASKQHRIVESAPVVPHGDPTLLFTNAGMNQFKDVFLGAGKRDYVRAADTQKCIRVSGKHNDLEEVGVDTYHHTFFEMLGNWSFGDYYKEEAIAWAWELLTDVWKLPKERLYATVYRTDDEAYQIWKKYLPESRIQRFDEKDNFWEMGETGPCGPCSEIHFDGTADMSGGPLVNASSPEVIEIWNLVFIQYNRKADGSLEELSAKHVDTGMGFERITRVIQGKTSNYDTNVFMPIINKIQSLCGKEYKNDLDDNDSIAMRVIADHIRTLSFSIADGALPGNEGRGYVLRRILRRASRFARNLGFKEPILYTLLPTLIEVMGDTFPEIIKQQEVITKIIKGEEESFLQTLEHGLNKFEELKANLNESKTLNGDDAFLLYDSFGFPLDLTELLAREAGLGVDIAGFNTRMAEQKARSRAARKVNSAEVEMSAIEGKSIFLGYEKLESEAKILYVKDNQVVLDQTPFYSESGGQVSDTGVLVLGGERYNVEDVRKSGDAIVHICDRDVEALVGGVALAIVDASRRLDIKRNHSATHLMHEALRMVLGTHIQQQGSLVDPDKLRFDFNHFEKVSKEQIATIEKIVNTKIMENHKVITNIYTIEEARQNPSIKMYFGDKYGDVVRAVVMDEKYSIELCGGTHVAATGEIGYFKISSESSVASGIRRIEAITGNAVEKFITELNQTIDEKAKNIEELQKQIRSLEKQLSSNKTEVIAQELDKLIANPKSINGINVVVAKLDVEDIEQLRELGETFRNKLTSNSIGLIASISDDKVQLVCVVSDDLVKKYQAGKMVGAAAKLLGGGGGGKPHLATAGGKDLTKLDELLNKEFYAIIESI